VNSSELLVEAHGRIRGVVHGVLDGIDPQHLTARLDPEANTVAWLGWHLARVQDDHVAEVAGIEQRWTADGWADRFDLPFSADAIGYGFNSEQVAAVRASAEQLAGYYDAVHDATRRFLTALTDADLDRVVDENWDPPVTLGARLVSVISDDLQHAGQAAYIRGVLERS
jgi:uncharacterized damage-inducible protein DinB